MKSMREYVAELSNDQRIQIIKDYEQLERDAAVDDCELRSRAMEYCKDNLPHIRFDARFMVDMANAVYRYYADVHLGRYDVPRYDQ